MRSEPARKRSADKAKHERHRHQGEELVSGAQERATGAGTQRLQRQHGLCSLTLRDNKGNIQRSSLATNKEISVTSHHSPPCHPARLT